MKLKGELMDKKIKLLAATSLVAVFVSGCTTAPAPWANQNRPAGGGSASQGGTAHQHNGVVHTHPLPGQGIHHTHQYGQGAGAVGQPVGSSGGNVNTNNNTGGGSQTYGYDYGGYGGATTSYDNSYNSGSNSGYYNDMNSGTNNYGSSYDGGSSSTSYGSNYDTSTYGGNSSTSSSLDMEDIKDPSYREGDTYYTVQRTNTVFAVMRITGAYWKDIVKWNNLQAPKYVIVPGQRLRVKP
jgi:hypothetical protein